MNKHTTFLVATGDDRGDQEARIVRYATENDFRDQFGDIIEARERKAIAAQEYLVVQYLTTERRGRRQTVHCTAIRSERPRLSGVVLETMPDQHRSSHRAARNWGTYPANGSERRIVSRDEAIEIVAADSDGYDHIVRKASLTDLYNYSR